MPVNIIIVTLFRSSKPSETLEIKKSSQSRAGSKASLADNTSVKSVDSSATLSSPESPILNNKAGEVSSTASIFFARNKLSAFSVNLS